MQRPYNRKIIIKLSAPCHDVWPISVFTCGAWGAGSRQQHSDPRKGACELALDSASCRHVPPTHPTPSDLHSARSPEQSSWSQQPPKIIIASIYLCRKHSSCVRDRGKITNELRREMQPGWCTWWYIRRGSNVYKQCFVCVCVKPCHAMADLLRCDSDQRTIRLQTWKLIKSRMSYTHSVFSVCMPMSCWSFKRW